MTTKRRAVCPFCKRELAVDVPAGGDGSVDVFPRHSPLVDTKYRVRPIPGPRCDGSRTEVKKAAYLTNGTPDD